jgi:methyl-accepting chemotaxis protein
MPASSKKEKNKSEAEQRKQEFYELFNNLEEKVPREKGNTQAHSAMYEIKALFASNNNKPLTGSKIAAENALNMLKILNSMQIKWDAIQAEADKNTKEFNDLKNRDISNDTKEQINEINKRKEEITARLKELSTQSGEITKKINNLKEVARNPTPENLQTLAKSGKTKETWGPRAEAVATAVAVLGTVVALAAALTLLNPVTFPIGIALVAAVVIGGFITGKGLGWLTKKAATKLEKGYNAVGEKYSTTFNTNQNVTKALERYNKALPEPERVELTRPTKKSFFGPKSP